MCDDGGHFVRDYPNYADRKEKTSNGSGPKNVNTVTASNTRDGYGNLLLFFQYSNLLVSGLIRMLMFMCVLTSLCILLTRSLGVLSS
jgi:hypothetical protein